MMTLDEVKSWLEEQKGNGRLVEVALGLGQSSADAHQLLSMLNQHIRESRELRSKEKRVFEALQEKIVSS